MYMTLSILSSIVEVVVLDHWSDNRFPGFNEKITNTILDLGIPFKFGHSKNVVQPANEQVRTPFNEQSTVSKATMRTANENYLIDLLPTN